MVKIFYLSCEDGQEEHLEELSQNLTEKFSPAKIKIRKFGRE